MKIAAPGSLEVGAEKVHAFLGGSLPLELEGDGDNASHDGSEAEAAGDLIVKLALLLCFCSMGRNWGKSSITAGNCTMMGTSATVCPRGGRFTACWLVPWATLLPSIHNW